MKNRYQVAISSLLMIFIGLFRSIGGISLLLGGDQLDTKVPILASAGQLNGVGIGLLTVGILLIVSAAYFWRRLTRRSWLLCWIALIIFLLDGLVDGFILFGQPLAQGQIINLSAAIIIGILLYHNRPQSKSG
jgi:hypothetical protein